MFLLLFWIVKKSLKKEMQNICRGEVATDGDWKGKAAEWAGLTATITEKMMEESEALCLGEEELETVLK